MGLKVPHMGWNQLQVRRQSPLLKSLARESTAYFVHSYYCVPDDEADVIAEVDYGITFTAAVQRDNVYGVQFHPEKSQSLGLQLLLSFLEL
jgi:glutamine amidotransferase